MNEQQLKTLSVRVHVARDIATERLLTTIAKEPLFTNVPSNEIVATIVGFNSFDEDTQADMLSYLESEREKRQTET